MKSKSCAYSATTYVLLGATGVVSFLLPESLVVQSAEAQAAPDSYTLRGVVRDFLSTHPDFGLSSTPSLSAIAGNVDPYLGPDGQPLAQSKVQSHGDNGLSTANVTVSKWSFDGGGAMANDNKGGHDGTLMNGPTRTKGIFGKAMSFDGVDDYVEVPHHADFLVDEAVVTFWFNAADVNPKQGLVSKDSTGNDTGGHFLILLENGRIRWRLQTTTSSYWAESPVGSVVPDTWHHVAASFSTDGMKLFLDNVEVDSDLSVTTGLGTSSGGAGNHEPWAFGVNTWASADLSNSGWIEPFNGMLDEIQIFTGVIADTEYKSTGGYLVGDHWKNGNGDNIAPHVYGEAWCDDGSSPAPCFDPSTDIAGTPGNTDSGKMSTTESFDEWFTDIMGVNMSTQHTIDMVKDGSGIYEFSDFSFDPINGALLGNEGDSNNANFTYAIEATFTYEQCTGQFFEFQGGDGAWLYLDGRLALDMGGIATNNHQLIELDRLCLQDGQDYSFHFFYANRQANPSEFTLRTNVWLRQGPLVMLLTVPYD